MPYHREERQRLQTAIDRWALQNPVQRDRTAAELRRHLEHADRVGGVFSLWLLAPCHGLPEPALLQALGIRRLEIQNARFTELPALHQGLRELYVIGSELTEIGRLPGTLEKLTLRCPRLELAPDTSQLRLRSLSVAGCTSLQTFPHVPETVMSLAIQGCEHLVRSGAGAAAVEAVRGRGGQIILRTFDSPEGQRPRRDGPHRVNALLAGGREWMLPPPVQRAGVVRAEPQAPPVRSTLGAAINHVCVAAGSVPIEFTRAWHEEVGVLRGADSLRGLVNRVLTESADVRGGLGSIAREMLPAVRQLGADPSVLEWANEEAGTTRQGCVNQPIQTWGTLARGLAVWEASQVREPAALVRASRHALAAEAVLDFVAQQIGSGHLRIGDAFHVEAGQYVLKQWDTARVVPGVPRTVAYEAGVAPVHDGGELVCGISPEFIRSASGVAQAQLQASARELSEGIASGVFAELSRRIAVKSNPPAFEALQSFFCARQALIQARSSGEDMPDEVRETREEIAAAMRRVQGSLPVDTWLRIRGVLEGEAARATESGPLTSQQTLEQSRGVVQVRSEVLQSVAKDVLAASMSPHAAVTAPQATRASVAPAAEAAGMRLQ